MPITELIIPGFKQDEATREAYSSTVLPHLVKIATGAPGLLSQHAGNILISNSTDVSLAFRPVLGIGWNSVADFQAFVSSQAFLDFRPLGLPLSAEITPIPPELYDTDIEPKSIYGSALTEVFRVKIGEDEEKKANVKEAWENFVKSVGTVKTLSGVSVNVPEKTFLGMIGYESEEARKNAYSIVELEALKRKVGVFDSFVGAFNTL